MKRFIAALLAGLTLFALVGCSAGSKADSAAPKDYSQILHDARTDEENEYDMIFTKGEDGKFTAMLGLSSVNTTMNIYAHAKKETTGSSARFLDKVAGES